MTNHWIALRDLGSWQCVFNRSFLQAAVAVVAIAACSACGTLEDKAVTDISLRNDTAHAVVVKSCTSPQCDHFRYVRRVDQGHSAPATDYGDATSWWLVATSRGAVLGCLSLGIGQRQEGYVLRISTLRTCPAKH